MSLTPEDREATIIQAMNWNFGDLLTWDRPDLLHTFGANNLEQVASFETKLLETRAEVRRLLDALPDEDVFLIKQELSDDFRISERNHADVLPDEIRKLRRMKPPAIAYGFGHPSFVARFDYWAKMPELGLHELSLVSLGVDPSCKSEDDLTKLQKTRDRGKTLWDADNALLEQREIFRRCYPYTGFGYPPVNISAIKGWIDHLAIDVHPQFYAGLVARVAPKRQPERQADVKPMTSQERNSLLKLVAAMACEQYQYDPKAERSETASRVQEDIELIGQSMDAKTIRKLLKEASVLVDDSYWQA